MIPAFDSNSVLPPHLGDPRKPTDVSPFPCTTLELVDRFGTTANRVEILRGFLQLRADLRQNGLVVGFQWLDGSVLEDIEKLEGRAPRDIDVVTFYWDRNPNFTIDLLNKMPILRDRDAVKSQHKTDHFLVDSGFSPEATIELTRYWCGLFSHPRSKIWKGMLRIDLNTPSDDTNAEQLLRSRP